MKRSASGNRKRDLRNRRMNAFKQWESGDLDGLEVQKERSTREGMAGKGHKRQSVENSNVEMNPAGTALVLEQHRRTCEVRLADGTITNCRYHPSLDLRPLGMLAVGDVVHLGKEPKSGDLYLSKVEERKSKLSRPGPPDREHREQVLAANIDQVVVVVSLKQPDFNSGFVDRYLMVCEASDIPVRLVVNKMDLQAEDLPESILTFENYLDKVVYTSVTHEKGLRELHDLLDNKNSVVTGQSGVGKSSLLQALMPHLEIRTGEVREGDGKGRHTTTRSTLFPVGTGWVIDTPGIRRLGFWKLDARELAEIFPFFQGLASCKFSDCLHLQEPGCAIKEAIETGEVPLLKYESYLRIQDSLNKRF